ncbi:GPP34 family phosphoprotein [Pengzhenrongella sicca]|uniref:GPP34 family phosphoprotein n=1 Tax=Pengzhenrongella sicca TaxID=2819238 RepID=A0A8A4ZEN4_9MICO|nr:GPP34 family phosphoprotein [Pengzhenrongella sicca]QTE28158.1 GPP34 family phosphoprotein [Pengzhenrongella sicca]
MTAMALSEELLLLAHDDEPDRPGSTLPLEGGLAAALLLDLATEGLLVAKGRSVVGVDGTASRPLLAAALAALRAEDEPHDARYWLAELPVALGPLRGQVGAAVAERGALTADRCAALGLTAAPGRPEVDPAPEHELRARLHRVLVYSGEPDNRTALLISLLRPLAMVRGVVDKQHRKQADALAKAITRATADAAATPAAISRAVHAAQAAVVIAAVGG